MSTIVILAAVKVVQPIRKTSLTSGVDIKSRAAVGNTAIDLN
jgi:hypothetical protein